MKSIIISLFILCTSLFFRDSKESPSVKDLVPDEQTAVKVAEAIWLPLYGPGIHDKKPFKAILKNPTLWIVTGTLNTRLGGVPYIEIQKKDCKIIKVAHGK